ncbi:MAG: enoyl-CoA hydratase/carnithine racemase [Hyphomicrobiaceae bacterium]|jgi:enoyl-CoA hydratase/carnithine racemase
MSIRFELPEAHPGVAVVTIDRPQKANSLTPSMLAALGDAWRRIADDDSIRCAIVTGAGDRVFSGGMDMGTTIPVSQALARGEKIDERDFAGLRDAGTALLAGFDLRTPLVAAINGHCRAGGFDMMLAAEIRLSVPHATFALEEVAIGLYPTGNTTVLLPKQIGWVHAHELMLTARPINAERAAAIGLVNRVVPTDQLLNEAFDVADAIARNAPLAVRATRDGVREILHLPLKQGWKRQEELGHPLRKTEDAKEGQRSFLEKRKPIWAGK